MKENLETILKLSLPIFIILGLAEITSYYRQFNFPIIEYLKFTEIITIFLSNLHVYTALFMQFAIFFLLDRNHFRGSLTLILLAFLFVGTYNFLSGEFRFNTSSSILNVTTIVLVVGASIIAISKLKVHSYISTLNVKSKKYIVSGFTFLFLLVISSFQGKFKSDFVKQKHIYSGTTLITKKDTIISNDTSYFIGKSNDYVFFFDELNKIVTVYPNSEIEQITYKTKPLK